MPLIPITSLQKLRECATVGTVIEVDDESPRVATRGQFVLVGQYYAKVVSGWSRYHRTIFVWWVEEGFRRFVRREIGIVRRRITLLYYEK